MRYTVINLICEDVEDLVVLPARGYRSVVFFCDSTIATLKILIKDNDKYDSLEAALGVVATNIKKK